MTGLPRLLLFSACSCPLALQAGTLNPNVIFTDDATSGISSSTFYTHLLDIGSGTAGSPVVNGVSFNTVVGSAQIGQYGWSTNQPNNGATNGTTGVAAGGMNALLQDIQWNANNPGTTQITGLEPGATYEARLYQRGWNITATPFNRTHDITFDDGSGSPSTTTLNPDAVPNVAQYLSYTYTAPANGVLDISWTPNGAGGTLHLYGLSNQLVSGGTRLHGQVTADNHWALYLGGADGSNMRYVGRDLFGDWRNAERYAMDYQPGDHIYIASWDNPGAVNDPQMVIGEFDLPGGGTLGTNGADWEVIESAPGANPGDTLLDADAPSETDISTLAGGSFGSIGAVQANTAGPWGPNADFAGDWVGSGAEFLWGDTFANVSQSNTNESFYLFRTTQAIVPIPEPSGVALVALATFGLAMRRRR